MLLIDLDWIWFDDVVFLALMLLIDLDWMWFDDLLFWLMLLIDLA